MGITLWHMTCKNWRRKINKCTEDINQLVCTVRHVMKMVNEAEAARFLKQRGEGNTLNAPSDIDACYPVFLAVHVQVCRWWECACRNFRRRLERGCTRCPSCCKLAHWLTASRWAASRPRQNSQLPWNLPPTVCYEIISIRYTNTHTHPFNGPLSGTTQVSRYWILLK